MNLAWHDVEEFELIEKELDLSNQTRTITHHAYISGRRTKWHINHVKEF